MSKMSELHAETQDDQLTLRDQFAIAALTGMLANHALVTALMKNRGATELAAFFEDHVYEYANSMMRARKASQNGTEKP